MLAKLAVLAAAAFIPASLAQLPPDCDRTYTIQPGDNCDTIAESQNVSTFQLFFVNPTINPECTNLFAGGLLCLGRIGQDCTTNHEVEEGEFCASIADDAGIALSTLLANNRELNSDCTNLRPGEVLCVSPTAIAYTSN